MKAFQGGGFCSASLWISVSPFLISLPFSPLPWKGNVCCWVLGSTAREGSAPKAPVELAKITG